MGKGGGCAPSKKQKDAVATGNTTTTTTTSTATPTPSATRDTPPATSQTTGDAADSAVVVERLPDRMTLKVFIVYYSMYGHVESLAKRMKKGVDGIQGVDAVLYRVAETLPQDVLDKMHAPPKDESVPIITAAELEKADGVLFGFPTRYGTMAAQMKAFFDSTGGLWKEQKLAGKPAGFFVSTGTQGGGQETTAWTAITQLAHHGMLFVPIGYTFGAGMFSMDEVKGGSPYGAGVYAGDGSRQASEMELSLAEHQGKYMASIVKRMLASS